MRRANSANQLR